MIRFDTARSGDANQATGPLFDALRHLDVSVLALDHLSFDVAKSPIENWRPMGSVRAVNRPRQTYATEARDIPGAGPGAYVIRLRCNFTNYGIEGDLIQFTVQYDGPSYRPETIRFGERSEADPQEIFQYDRALVAIVTTEQQGKQPSPTSVAKEMGVDPANARKYISLLRDKDYITPTGEELASNTQGRKYLQTKFGDKLPASSTAR